MRFLFVDRILELEEGKMIRGVKHVTADDPFLTHSPTSSPFFIPSFLGETLGQLAAWNVMKTQNFKARPVAGILSRAAVHRPAFIGETIALESIIDQLDETVVEYHSNAYVGDQLIFTLEGALGPMLPMENFIDESEVRLQFDHIFRPGVWPGPRSLPQRAISSSIPTAATQPFQFDHILSLEPGKHLQAEKCINFAAPYFPDHFPKNPVLPLTVLLECKHNLAQTFLKASGITGYRLFELKKIKMKDFVHPGDVIQSTLILKHHDSTSLTVNVQTELEGKRICTVDMTFIPETLSCNQDA